MVALCPDLSQARFQRFGRIELHVGATSVIAALRCSSESVSAGQATRMVLQVVSDERLDEVVAVVVARVAANVQRLTHRRARLFEEMGMELGLEELVVLALVDEDRSAPCAGSDQCGRVMLGPHGPVVAEVAAETPSRPRDHCAGAQIGAKADTVR